MGSCGCTSCCGGAGRMPGAAGLAMVPSPTAQAMPGATVVHLLGGGVGLRSFGVLEGGQWVDIYLSAGPNDGAGGAHDASCKSKNDANCALDRVRWNLAAGEDAEVTRVSSFGGSRDCAGGLGDVQPALSPDQTKLAWVRHCHDGGGTHRESDLLVEEAGSIGSVATGTAEEDRPHFPNWYTNDILLYHTKSGDDHGTLWATTSSTPPFAPYRLLGQGGLYENDTSFKDANTHPNPEHSAGLPPRIVTFGGAFKSASGLPEQTPRVTNFLGSFEEALDLTGEGDETFTECHHPAWNVSGTEILCMRNREPEHPDGRRQPWLKALYKFSWDERSSTWRNRGLLFVACSLDALKSTFPAFFSTVNVAGVTYKYAEWCGSDKHVLATVYLSDDDENVLMSRVMLIDISTPKTPTYRDISSVVERMGPDSGGGSRTNWHAIYGTCSVAHPGPWWVPCAG